MSTRGRIGVAALVGVLAVCVAAVATAQPAPTPERSLLVRSASAPRSVLRPSRHASAVRRYWTPRRMRAAVALGPVEVNPRAVATPPAGPAAKPSRIPARVGAPFNRYEVTDTTAFPARTSGRVFFTLGDSDYACSGTAVNSTDQSVVFSAGHCVTDPDTAEWATNWTFVPGYRQGAEPFGEFVATQLVSPSGWSDSGYFSYDIGAALVGRNGAGRTLQSALGGAGRGIAFNQPREQNFQAWGYPADGPFDGERLYVCESAFAGDDPFPDPVGPHGISIGCDMTAGSSGGGWIINGKYLNSVNSFGYDGLPNVLFGPYFGDAAKALYDRVCCRDGVAPPDPPPPAADAPDTTFTAHPAHRIRAHRVFFAFRSSVAGATFECLYTHGWNDCRSPQRFSGLQSGYSYLFKARAVVDGVKDPTPAVWSFRVR